jgi:hypothetical protein
MRLLELRMTNVGPFDEAALQFLEDPDDPRTVSFVIGENGTGKTMVLDAIRACFGPEFGDLDRPLGRPGADLAVSAELAVDGKLRPVEIRAATEPDWRSRAHGSWVGIEYFHARPPRWVADHWRADVAHDSGRVDGIRPAEHRAMLHESLSGTPLNVDVTQLLCYLDYLRDSRNPQEAEIGAALWALVEDIVRSSLLEGGELVRVDRITFTPMIAQAGRVVPLPCLSSGNLHLLGRMLTLLARMYSVTVLRGEDPAASASIPGLLLLDEAESHLHPRWQARLLPTVRRIFPNLQIVATTHSDAVLASVPDARVFLCRHEPAQRRCTITPTDPSA